MQRVYITSCPSRFGGQALDTKTYRDVKTFCYLDKHGIEIQIFSTSGDNNNVWWSYPEAQNRYVGDLRYNDPEYSPQKEQPTIQSGPQCSLSMITILFAKGNGKTSPPMKSATNMSWDTISQNLSGNWYVTKVAMTEKQMGQFTGE